MNIKFLATIPARSGSKRVKDKNIKILNDHPLLAYSICAAIDSGIFDSVICVTDSELYGNIARHYGAEVPFIRPPELSGDKSPDIEWAHWILSSLKTIGRLYDVFSILRPTNPFRLPETIQRASIAFKSDSSIDSLRAVEKCKQHPGKMWVIREKRLHPILPFTNANTPWHSSQYAALPEIYAQNASLEMAWTRVVLENNSITGESIMPFISEGIEGFDINEPEDWLLAEYYTSKGKAELPTINQEPYQFND